MPIKKLKLHQLEARLIRVVSDLNNPKLLDVIIIHNGHIVAAMNNCMVYDNYVLLSLDSGARIYYETIKAISYIETSDKMSLQIAFDDNDVYHFQIVYPKHEVYQVTV